MEKVSSANRIPLYLSGLIGILIGVLLVLGPFVFIKAGIFFDTNASIICGSILTALIGVIFFAKKFLIVKQNRDALCFFILMATPYFTAFSSYVFHPTFMMLVVMMGIWLLRGIVENHIDIVFNESFFILILFYLSAGFALLLGPNHEIGIFFRIFFLFFPIFCLTNLIRSENQLLKCFDYLFVFAFISCLIGIAQLYGFITTFSFDYSDPLTNTILGGRIVKMTGFVNSADTYVNTISLCVLISSYFLISFKGLSFSKKLFYSSFCILGLLVIFLSQIRMAWVGLAVCVFLILFLKKPQWTLHYIIAVSLAGFIGYFSGLIPTFYEMMYSLRPESVDFRGIVNRLAIDTILDYPLTGVGLNAVRHYNNATGGVPHIIWLQLGAGVGIIATFLYFIYMISLFVRVVHRIRIEPEGQVKFLFQAGLLGLVYTLVIGLFSPDFFEKIFWFYFGLLESALFVLKKGKEKMSAYRPVFGLNE